MMWPGFAGLVWKQILAALDKLSPPRKVALDAALPKPTLPTKRLASRAGLILTP
jgi:hypothetical protein